MIKNNKIYQTNNYNKFNNFLGNRSVASVTSRHHIEKLMESMKKSYLPQPIIVDENMAVLDGQHRLEAARQLNLPIYYLKMHSPISVMDIQRVNNVTNKWDTNDYLSSNLEFVTHLSSLYSSNWLFSKSVFCLNCSFTKFSNTSLYFLGYFLLNFSKTP